MEINDIKVKFPDAENRLDQHQEWFEVEQNGETEKLRIHDYDKVYTYPGLYEGVVCEHLKCRSPEVVCELLNKELPDWKKDKKEVNVLDLGAGNGMVGETLCDKVVCNSLVGVDIFPEAKKAALRDRPGIYSDYCVTDLRKQKGVEDLTRIQDSYNLLVTVAALGFGDIPVDAFLNAFNLLEDGSLVAFNIKDRFISDDDDTGFKSTIQTMCRSAFDVKHTRKYRHRISMAGEPLHYVAVVGEKRSDADPGECLAELSVPA